MADNVYENEELEPILIKKENPSRVDDKEGCLKKCVKLTGRTFKSFFSMIKDETIGRRRIKKYNKAHQIIIKQAIRGDEKRDAQKNGADITDSEIKAEYDIAVAQSKKLGKLGAKLVKNDIRKIAKEVKAVHRPIRVPRFLADKLRFITVPMARIGGKIADKRAQRVAYKEMMKGTAKNIQNSIENAFYKDVKSGVLQNEVDAEPIKDTRLGDKKYDTDRRLDPLRSFISKDGKTPLFTKDEDDLDKKGKSGTDLPPTEPVATAKKEEPKFKVSDLLKNLNMRKTSDEDLTKKESEKKPESKEENLANKPEHVEDDKPKTSEKHNRDEEINELIKQASRINALKTAIKETSDKDTKKALLEKLDEEKERLGKMIDGDKPTVKKSKTSSASDEKQERLEPIKIEPKKSEIEVKQYSNGKNIPITEEKPKIENVEMKDSESMRAQQVTIPSELRVTLQDIKRLEMRNDEAQKKLANLKKEKAGLEEQRNMLKKYIEIAKLTMDSESKAASMTTERNELGSEVSKLNSEAVAVSKGLGNIK